MKRHLLILAIIITTINLAAQTPTVASLVATGTGIKWYTTSTGGTALDTSTPLVNAQHYWASQTIYGVESTARFEVTATVTPCVTAPVVTTSAVTDIGGTIATLNGNITAVGGANATIHGFKYSTSDGFNPATQGSNISENGNYGTGSFSLSPSNLTSTTTYYVVAYATNSAGTTYGSQVTFTTVVYTVWTLTNANATGRTGPTQAQVNTAYSGTSLQGGVTINTQGIQEWTVPVTGTYQINVKGAGGGANYYTQRVRGGYGTQMIGNFTLTAGQVLKIIVGQRGLDGTINDYAGDPNPQEAGGSAGGGSFVTYSDNSPLIVAGGGGGATTRLTFSNDIGGDGQTGTTGGSGITASPGAGGTGGSGGGGCSNAGYQGGSGGGGITGNGGNSAGAVNYGSINYGGYAFVNNATGGVAGTGGSVGVLREGGFGGGGCGGYTGGGGGGYSGGGAGGDGGSGGGGSINNGSNQSNAAGSNSGNGQVIITKL